MTRTDPGALERYLRSVAADLRGPGLVLEDDPDAITRFLDLPAVAIQQRMLMPARFDRGADAVPPFVPNEASCLEWVLAAEWLAWGDPGMTLASPGPSLST